MPADVSRGVPRDAVPPTGPKASDAFLAPGIPDRTGPPAVAKAAAARTIFFVADDLTCDRCGRRFSVPESVQRRYPGWKPRVCLRCRARDGAAGSAGGKSASPARPVAAPPAPLPSAPGADPPAAVYTDGSCQGNPGPGGWGAVLVRGDTLVTERRGFDPATTNNRMELTGVIEGLKLAPTDGEVTLFTDSQLVVRTLNGWAAQWEKRGWKRRDGEVKNLDLVQEAWRLLKERPNVRVEWVAGHAGERWNEYADALSTAHLREGRTA